MKATIDIPDALYRRVKARAALDGRAVREVTVELYTRWLGEGLPDPADGRDLSAGAEWLARWQELGDELLRKAVDPRLASEIILAERR
jgi:hypothetical protein